MTAELFCVLLVTISFARFVYCFVRYLQAVTAVEKYTEFLIVNRQYKDINYFEEMLVSFPKYLLSFGDWSFPIKSEYKSLLKDYMN